MLFLEFHSILYKWLVKSTSYINTLLTCTHIHAHIFTPTPTPTHTLHECTHLPTRALTNTHTQGKGTEDISHYARARLTHLDIPNIHAVRESYEALRSVCLSTVSGKWHSALESTQWLNYISVILKVRRVGG